MHARSLYLCVLSLSKPGAHAIAAGINERGAVKSIGQDYKDSTVSVWVQAGAGSMARDVGAVGMLVRNPVARMSDDYRRRECYCCDLGGSVLTQEAHNMSPVNPTRYDEATIGGLDIRGYCERVTTALTLRPRTDESGLQQWMRIDRTAFRAGTWDRAGGRAGSVRG